MTTTTGMPVRWETVRLTLAVQLKHAPEVGEATGWGSETWAVYWDEGEELLGYVYPDMDPDEWNWYFTKPHWPDPDYAGGYEDAIQALVESSMELK